MIVAVLRLHPRRLVSKSSSAAVISLTIFDLVHIMQAQVRIDGGLQRSQSGLHQFNRAFHFLYFLDWLR